MKAIQSRTLGWTNSKHTRIKVVTEKCPAKVMSYSTLEDELIASGLEEIRDEHIHNLAARKYADALGWPEKLVTGYLPNGDFAHCLLAAELDFPVAELLDLLEGTPSEEAVETAVAVLHTCHDPESSAKRLAATDALLKQCASLKSQLHEAEERATDFERQLDRALR